MNIKIVARKLENILKI